MSKISPLSGFPELLPAQRAVEREVIDSEKDFRTSYAAGDTEIVLGGRVDAVFKGAAGECIPGSTSPSARAGARSCGRVSRECQLQRAGALGTSGHF